MIIRDGDTHYSPIAWSEAFDIIGEHVQATGPNRSVFSASGRAPNETEFLYQLLARSIGTNNLPDRSNMCHESSRTALSPTIGIGKGTVSLEDLEKTELIFVVGQNPETNHPRMLGTLAECRRNGGKVVAVNPLPEAGLLRFKDPQTPKGLLADGERTSDEFLQIRVGGDQALFQALGHLLLKKEADAPGTIVDRDFIESSTDGFAYYADARKDLNWAEIELATGLERTEIEHVADLLAASKATIFCWPSESPSSPTPSTRSRRSSTCSSCRATSANPGPVPAPYADIPMSRATGPSGSGRNPRKTSSSASTPNSASAHRGSMATTRPRRCMPWPAARSMSSSPSAGTSQWRTPTPPPWRRD